MTTSDIATKLRVRPETVVAWEVGDKRPTFLRAQTLAKKLYIPFGYLYLHEPPVEKMPLADFRATGGAIPKPSPDLLDVLTDILGKQQWLKDYKMSEGDGDLPFVGRFGITDSEKEVANNMRNILDVDDARHQAHNMDDFLRNLVHNAEDAGIAVMCSGMVRGNNRRPLDRTEFRGFSIYDKVVPLVFINTCDFRGSLIFTLAHEMAHIWVGKGGVSNPDYELQHNLQDNPVEQFCNRVAADTLVPSHDFLSRWRSKDTSESNLDHLRKHYKVSAMVVLRQALDNNLITIPEYKTHYTKLVESIKDDPDKSGGHFHRTLITRNGNMFTGAVITSTIQGTTLSSESAYMLNVKVKTLSGIIRHLYGDSLV